MNINISNELSGSIQYCIDNNIDFQSISPFFTSKISSLDALLEYTVNKTLQIVIDYTNNTKDLEIINIVKTSPTIKAQIDLEIDKKKVVVIKD